MAQRGGHGAAGEDGHGYDEDEDGIIILNEITAAVIHQAWIPQQQQRQHPPLIMSLPKRARSASLDAAAAAVGTPPRPTKRRDVAEGATAADITQWPARAE
ncbi:hypothetical protein AMAG_18373 [Allomyces macrogynus ATCC 38327]|uniref:Uncharacterized protein n=1 Tax=Allomyces macrogynus (strain ATCC 38327) TaxID=578462 RepID=A0A0L0S6U9_ALLM3|nr:hypothetical protein AMAG_18373 [Allomyces macrogynus ATCC 38327]|eukprot:KNE58111.1 hypothetical protein AMAG_18373 [Allomyces macrogynus ATCC 38327]